jgi:hypothetical protein
MKHRTPAYLAAAWAIVFAAPHVYWATGRTDGLGTALSDRVVAHAGLAMALSCAGIAAFCLAGAAVAIGTIRSWPPTLKRRARTVLVALTWFGAILLTARCLDIYIEFNLMLTGLEHIPADQHTNFMHLSRWFMFCYLPWFTLGAATWLRLAWTYSRAAPPAQSPRTNRSGAPSIGSDVLLR